MTGLVELKTTKQKLFDAIVKLVREKHPYHTVKVQAVEPLVQFALRLHKHKETGGLDKVGKAAVLADVDPKTRELTVKDVDATAKELLDAALADIARQEQPV